METHKKTLYLKKIPVESFYLELTELKNFYFKFWKFAIYELKINSISMKETNFDFS